jgi:hypothetical protein
MNIDDVLKLLEVLKLPWPADLPTPILSRHRRRSTWISMTYNPEETKMNVDDLIHVLQNPQGPPDFSIKPFARSPSKVRHRCLEERDDLLKDLREERQANIKLQRDATDKAIKALLVGLVFGLGAGLLFGWAALGSFT